jgi:hypothetical protein
MLAIGRLRAIRCTQCSNESYSSKGVKQQAALPEHAKEKVETAKMAWPETRRARAEV